MVAEQKLGISDAQLRRYVAAASDIPSQRLRAIAEYGGVTLDWLVYGDGPMLSGRGNELVDDKSEDVVMIPILNIDVAAGAGALNGDVEALGHLPFSRDYLRRHGMAPAHVRAVRAVGESMAPTIESGALVLLDQSKNDMVDGAVFVVSLGEEVRIKRVHKTLSGLVTLKSDNENKQLFPDEPLAPTDLEQVKVAGRVFWAEKLL